MVKINHITILVKNIERSKNFYSELLGLKSTFEIDISGNQFSRVTGIKDVKIRFAALKSSSSHVILELAQFVHPKRRSPAMISGTLPLRLMMLIRYIKGW